MFSHRRASRSRLPPISDDLTWLKSQYPSREKFIQGQAVFRRLRMQGKGNPLYLDIVCLFEFFNTPGNEVTPRSDIVGENSSRIRSSCSSLFPSIQQDAMAYPNMRRKFFAMFQISFYSNSVNAVFSHPGWNRLHQPWYTESITSPVEQ